MGVSPVSCRNATDSRAIAQPQPDKLSKPTSMKIIIFITIAGTSALMLWLAYSNHRRHLSKLRRGVRDQAVSSANHPQPATLLPLPRSARWSFINEWQVQAQHNDRQPVNAFVEPRTDATASARCVRSAASSIDVQEVVAGKARLKYLIVGVEGK
jgi:hypothetical protein